MTDRKSEGGSNRRGFLKASTTVVGASMIGVGTQAAASEATRPTIVSDVIVVGTGAAGLSAAIAARRAGASVVVLEKGAATGGTTAKSGGGCWVPNNHHLRAAGESDPKQQAIAYMLSNGWPIRFRKNQPKFGLDREYDMVETYYDTAAAVFEDYERNGIVEWQVSEFPNYNDRSPYLQDPERALRSLFPATAKSGSGGGAGLVKSMRDWCTKNGVQILTRHAVERLTIGADGGVDGVEGMAGDAPFAAAARRGVVFGSGGFSHNRELMAQYISPAILPGCGSPNSQGDFVRIASRVGARFGNMINAWKAEIVIEEAVHNGSVTEGIWVVPGDSAIAVNKYGRRVVDEKRAYHNRTQAHMVFDPLAEEYPNFLLFMIYDQRTAELFGGTYPMPSTPTGAQYIISAPTLDQLAGEIQKRLDGIADAVGEVKLSPDFSTQTRAQIERFNADTRNGADDEFGRDKYGFDIGATKAAIEMIERNVGPIPPNEKWSMDGVVGSRHPIDLDGPFYCMILGGGALDTNGGPMTDTKARILHVDGQPIPRLYGAGNCVAAPAGGTYWGAGSTIGPAIAFGTIAGRNAAGGHA
ncbi:FAD-dependent oxidoreductase [Croceicoccus bisphenolivorans]|uniref:FAD-dependent oxidoreductase n=1 Tax=Croceicoccus bisphenolivorans TaxID=1783232 RepID=UPI000831D333|nr:FAD-dependent oxidoreductase [Croceicoccus bisphenolivorans]